MAGEKQSFRELLLKGRDSTDREKIILEYICYRAGDGAHFGDLTQEEYVRRNASSLWVQDTLDKPRLVAIAHEKMRDDFSSGHLNPRSFARTAQ